MFAPLLRRSNAYVQRNMTQIASRLTPPLHIPLMALFMLALAASTLLALKHEAPVPRVGYAVAAGASASHATPYGSGAAIRNLLF